MIVAAAFVVLAAKPEDAGPANADTGKNMTYGQCVSAAAIVKNTCYATVKQAQTDCKAAANADAKQCKATYKKDTAECKKTFKATKKNECAKIKHNFLETLGSAFK